MEVYGFTAKVFIGKGTFSGEVEDLRVIARAKSLKRLKEKMEIAAEAAIKTILENPSNPNNHYPITALLKLGLVKYDTVGV